MLSVSMTAKSENKCISNQWQRHKKQTAAAARGNGGHHRQRWHQAGMSSINLA
jgi:hypothetical protein